MLIADCQGDSRLHVTALSRVEREDEDVEKSSVGGGHDASRCNERILATWSEESKSLRTSIVLFRPSYDALRRFARELWAESLVMCCMPASDSQDEYSSLRQSASARQHPSIIEQKTIASRHQHNAPTRKPGFTSPTPTPCMLW